MDEKGQILLHSMQNIRTVNADSFQKIELSNKQSLLHEYDVKNVLSATELFNIEREENAVYRIYGKIEYMSLLNGLRNDYSMLQHYFMPVSGDSKTLINSFDFYLVRPYTGYTQITDSIVYKRYFQVIATPNEFDIYPAGFTKNIYDEQAYAFIFNEDFDVSTYFDEFGFPVTELFIYAQYKPKTVPPETISRTNWTNTGVEQVSTFPVATLNKGDYVKTNIGEKIGDLIEYSEALFLQEQHTEQTFYIKTQYVENSVTKYLVWKYNPFIPLQLRYFTEQTYESNISGTSYEQVTSIPAYATEYPTGTGNYVWRNILEQGYIDPLTGIGVDYPFVNKKRYLFANIVLDVIPDLNDANTLAAFSKIKYGTPTNINIEPVVDDLNNIGKPCQ